MIPIQTAEVNRKFTDLIDAAPTTLNTLNEISTAFNDDSNFSTIITNSQWLDSVMLIIPHNQHYLNNKTI